MTTSARGSGRKSGRVVIGVQARRARTGNAERGTGNRSAGVAARDPTLLFRVPPSTFRISVYAAAYPVHAYVPPLSPSPRARGSLRPLHRLHGDGPPRGSQARP